MKIVIDAVNTILFHKPSIPALYSMVLKKYGYKVTPNKITETRKKILVNNRSYEGVCKCNDANRTYQKKWNYLTTLIIKEFGVSTNMANKIASEIHSKINDENANIVIEPSFIAILEKLQNEGHSMGILANGYPVINTWLRSLNADKYFDFILISSEIGHLKPCPFAFRIALDEAGQNNNIPSVFVGDDLYQDGFGAICGGFDAAVIIEDSKPYLFESEKVISIPTSKLLLQALKEVKEVCVSQ